MMAFLYATVALWIMLVITLGLPLFSLPLAKQKRMVISALLGVGTVFALLLVLAKPEVVVVTLLSWVIFELATAVLFYLLRRLDYYLDELLYELWLLIMSSFAIAATTLFWSYGLFIMNNLVLLRVIAALVPVLLLGGSWLGMRSSATIWSIGLFIVLIMAKSLLTPLWGMWALVLLILYAVLGGYLMYWMINTTDAEKILAFNVQPARLWAILAIVAGVLVLSF